MSWSWGCFPIQARPTDGATTQKRRGSRSALVAQCLQAAAPMGAIEAKVGWCNPDAPPIPDQLYPGVEFRPADVATEFMS